MDVHTKKQRSFNMSQIKNSGTSFEIKFRKYIWSKGIRNYRIKNKISGKPDLYFPKKGVAVFVDGCFWHKCPDHYVRPKSNTDFWDGKISENVLRDKRIYKILSDQKIKVLRIWQHQIDKDLNKSFNRLFKILSN